jgi:aspartyl-tRNA(Asn)/glutamyl-tRNA(Gln) amidotransferase subunit B
MTDYQKYEAVIGLEVHAQLLTQSKLFCGDGATYGAEPNTQVSPITLGHPGTLPRLNRKAIEHAIKMGMVCHCDINRQNYFARKNYFYPDLPKGYQVSQHTTPICEHGFVEIRTESGKKKIRLTRIHLEEDAGKSIHDIDPHFTSIDYNRAGVPLIEIVSEPDLRSSEDAHAYLTEIRKLVRWIGVCDGNMEEGSLRCDANISVRLKGETKLGTKVEVKNLNSIRNVRKAIEVEIKRQVECLESGQNIFQETRSFDANNDSSFPIRTKEDADDYRYFPEPDLTPFNFQEEFLNAIKNSLPALPEELFVRYTEELGLPEYDAGVLTDDRETALYYEALISLTRAYKSAANWILGPVKSYCNEKQIELAAFPVKPAQLASVIELVEEGKLSFSAAANRLLPQLAADPTRSAGSLAESMNLIQDADSGSINNWVEQVLAKMPEKVAEYKRGKKGLLGLFVGEVKKLSKGKADPKMTNDLLLEKLSQ